MEATEAEGPGLRFAVWLQGCPLRCPGCCNPEMLPFEGGEGFTVDALAARVERANVAGVTLLGGEPFAQAGAAATLCERVQASGRTVMVFSGFTLEELSAREDPDVRRLLAATDVLVDGRYDRTRPDAQRRWIGSTNQRLHFLTERHRADEPSFTSANTVELRLERGALTVNGWPALARLVTARGSSRRV